tara:strand:- start:1592 stop:1891 length:300 start_codon:yes stop_codon:yes gene_type:complete
MKLTIIKYKGRIVSSFLHDHERVISKAGMMNNRWYQLQRLQDLVNSHLSPMVREQFNAAIDWGITERNGIRLPNRNLYNPLSIGEYRAAATNATNNMEE